MSDYSLLGFTVIAAGILVLFIATLLASKEDGEGGRAKGAGVVMIGPIPIIFGNDSRLLVVAIALAIILLLLALVVGFR